MLAVSVLHFLPADLAAILSPYRRRLTVGSVLVFSHGSTDHEDPALAARCSETFAAMNRSDTPLVDRDRRQLRASIQGLRLVSPGLTDVTAWPTVTGETPVGMYAALAQRRAS